VRDVKTDEDDAEKDQRERGEREEKEHAVQFAVTTRKSWRWQEAAEPFFATIPRLGWWAYPCPPTFCVIATG
jgi:hypothetical protein